MVHIERTPLSSIRRAEVYVNSEKKPLHEIVEEQQPDIALPAAFYDPGSWRPRLSGEISGKGTLFRSGLQLLGFVLGHGP